MRVRPTELGLKGVLLLAALELAFLATSYSNLFFLLIVFCCVLGGLGLLTAIANLRAVHVTAVDVPPGAAEAPRALRVDVAARRLAFDLALSLDDGERCLPLPVIPAAQGRRSLVSELPPLPRGVRRLRFLRIATRFPFGLFEVSVRRPLTNEIVTHPAPLPAATAARSGTGGHGDGAGAAARQVAGLRPFRQGDSVRDVHWKATARRGTPVVKEHDVDGGAALTLVIDRRGDAKQLEQLLSAATAAAFATASSTRALRVCSQGFTALLPAGSPPGLDVLRWLAAADVLPPTAAAPELPPHGREHARA